jgi:hypothetical protein
MFLRVKIEKGILFGTANSNRSFKLFPKRSDKNGRLLLPMRGLVSTTLLPFTPLVTTPFVDVLCSIVFIGKVLGTGRTSG